MELGNTPQKQTVRRQADGARFSVGFRRPSCGEACVGRVPVRTVKRRAAKNLSNVFRFTPDSGHRSVQSACLKGANTGTSLPIRLLISAREQRGRHFEAERLRGFITSSSLVGACTGRSAGGR